MKLLITAIEDPDERAMLAFEYNCRALILMLEKFLVRKNFLAALISMTAPKY